jgi:hypothetical protein
MKATALFETAVVFKKEVVGLCGKTKIWLSKKPFGPNFLEMRESTIVEEKRRLTGTLCLPLLHHKF